MKEILSQAQDNPTESTRTGSTATNSDFTTNNPTFILPTIFDNQDDDSVSTFGNSVQQKWNPNPIDKNPITHPLH